jgi:hypothetical protein
MLSSYMGSMIFFIYTLNKLKPIPVNMLNTLKNYIKEKCTSQRTKYMSYLFNNIRQDYYIQKIIYFLLFFQLNLTFNHATKKNNAKY